MNVIEMNVTDGPGNECEGVPRPVNGGAAATLGIGTAPRWGHIVSGLASNYLPMAGDVATW
jgi:hypothetical protein